MPAVLQRASLFLAAMVVLSSANLGLAQTARRTSTDSLPGLKVFVPDKWNIVGVTVANPTDRPLDLLATHAFPTDPGLQFGRELWVPAQARRMAWYPLRPPAGAASGRSLPVRSVLIDRSSGREVLLKDPSGPLINDGLLPLRQPREPATGLIADVDDQESGLLPQVSHAAIQRPVRVARLDGDTLPPIPEALASLDQLVISSDRPATDPAGALAIRQWLLGGGHLWIRLDRTSPEVVSLLLGEDFPCTVVDRIRLTSWQIERGPGPTDPDEPILSIAINDKGSVGEYEEPVEMVRVLVPEAKAAFQVNGWPVAFWKKVGQGRVLFTTLGPRGWVHERPPQQRRRSDPQNPVSHLEEGEPLRLLAQSFLKARRKPPVEAAVFEPLLEAQVGYPVVGRGTVLTVLGTFCLVLLLLGVWFGRSGDLAHLGWIGPTMGLGTAATIIGVGYVVRGDVPTTAAIGQMLEITPGHNDTPVTGLLTLYAAEAGPTPLGADRGGVFVPQVTGHLGSTRRMIWSDMDRWRWQQPALPSGVYVTPVTITTPLSSLPAARLTYGPEGVVGTLDSGPLKGLGDAVIATPFGRHLAIRPDSTLKAGPTEQLARGQYILSTVVSDDQRFRQTVYRQLLERKSVPRYPDRTMLLTWADPLDVGLVFPQGTRRTGAALVAIPVEFDAPAPGTKVLVPGPFLPYRCDDRLGYGLKYDHRRHEWLGPQSKPTKTMLRFQLPAVLAKLKIEQATMFVDVNAPGRPVQLLADSGKELDMRESPIGQIRFTIDRADALQQDAQNAIHLGLSVGDPAGLTSAAAGEWVIRDVWLELTGQMAEE